VGHEAPLIGVAALGVLAAVSPGPGTADLELLESLRVVAEHVARVRGEEPGDAPVAVRASSDDLAAAAAERALVWVPRATRGPRGRAWADLGLGDGAALEEVLTRLATGVPGIALAGGRLLVAPELLPVEDVAPSETIDAEQALLLMTGVAADEPVAAHWIVHWRNERRPAGPSNGEAEALTTDSLLAQRAWSEGEANLVALLHLFGGMGLASDVVERGIGPASVLDGRLAPAAPETSPLVVQRFVEFVFLEGFAGTRDRFAAGGWNAVDAARSRRTAASVLHPDLAAPNAPGPVPAPAPPTGGVRLADVDSLGEQGVIVLVSKLTGKDSLALVAGDGLRDDRVFRWEDDRGGGATEWWTRWATDADAADFDYAYRRGIGVLCGAEPAPEAGTWRAACRGRVWSGSLAGTEARVRVHPATWEAWLPPAAGQAR
jgi:hypothetical protein